MECPLCMEALDLDDRSFFPCSCGYQICRFCWHRLRSTSHTSDFDSNSCPACRKPYQDQPATFKPTPAQDLKAQRRDRKKKTVSKRELAELRVLQRNLIFVVGLSARISEVELLKRGEYFGRFGRIVKVVVNQVKEGQQQQGSTAYITYSSPSEALRAITTVNNTLFDGRLIKVNLGTTKYCSHFLKNQACPKSECMYLHAVGDEEASFTKEDMLRGRHSELERRLIEEWQQQQQAASGVDKAVQEGKKKKGERSKQVEKQQQKGPLPAATMATTSTTDKTVARDQPAMVARASPPQLVMETAVPQVSDGGRPVDPSPWQQQPSKIAGPPPGLMPLLPQQQQNGFHGGPTASLSAFQSAPPQNPALPPFTAATALQPPQPLQNGYYGLDDELGFDPFAETQKQFEELIREESRRWVVEQQQQGGVAGSAVTPQQPGPAAALLQPFSTLQQQPPQQQPGSWLDDPAIIYSSLGSRQRPPPGFYY